MRTAHPSAIALSIVVLAGAACDRPPDAAERTSLPRPSGDGDERAPEDDGRAGDGAQGLGAPEDDDAATRGPFPAWGGLLAGSTLVLLGPELETLRAVDVTSGITRWRVRFQDTARGGHHLSELDGGRVLVHAGGTLHVFEIETGRRISEHPGPFNGVEPGARVWLWRERGVCAIHSPCSLQLVSCSDARPLGARLRGNVIRRYPARRDGRLGAHHTGCWGFSPHILGRAGPLAIVHTEYDRQRAPETEPVHRAMAVAIDLETGEDRWISTEIDASRALPGASGIDPRGESCWATSVDHELTAFDCATGRARFSQSGVERVRYVEGSGLWIEPTRGAGRWRDARTGASRRGPAPPSLVPEVVSPSRFEIERGQLESRTPSIVRLGGREVARFETDAWALAEHRAENAVTLVLYVSSADGPGVVHLIRDEQVVHPSTE